MHTPHNNTSHNNAPHNNAPHTSGSNSQKAQASSASLGPKSSIGINTPSLGLPRIAGAIVLGATATFSLFVLMHHLTSNDDIEIVKVDPLPHFTSIYQEKDESIRKTRREAEPPPPVIKPPQTPREIAPPQEITGTGFTEPGLDGIDTVPTDTQAGPFTLASDARPIVRIDPEYPPDAARDGLEGWVELNFSIDESGAVRNVVVVNSEPKRVFDRAAKRALQRWKYQAKREEGRAVMQEGLSVMLEFRISS